MHDDCFLLSQLILVIRHSFSLTGTIVTSKRGPSHIPGRYLLCLWLALLLNYDYD